jgi:phosphate transport system permease protein
MIKTYHYIKTRDFVMKGVFLFCAIFSVLALASICVFLFSSGVPFIVNKGFFKFILGTDWNITSSTPSFGILPMIVASLYVTALSTLIGVTIGLLTAIALYKFCPKKLVGGIKQVINILAGIPSVIYGLFGMIIIVPFLRDNISPSGVGYGILAASLVLSIMILPTIVSVSLDALNAVPKDYYQGALALGATKEQSVFKVVVPAAKSGIMAAVVLSIGRAIGETMAVIMVIGGSTQMPNSLFQSVRTLTANIAMGATELSGDAATALIATGVVLFTFTLLLNISFSLLKEGKEKPNAKPKSQKANP